MTRYTAAPNAGAACRIGETVDILADGVVVGRALRTSTWGWHADTHKGRIMPTGAFANPESVAAAWSTMARAVAGPPTG